MKVDRAAVVWILFAGAVLSVGGLISLLGIQEYNYACPGGLAAERTPVWSEGSVIALRLIIFAGTAIFAWFFPLRQGLKRLRGEAG